MRKRNGLISKINRAFLLQALLISVAALLSVFFAKIVLEEVLIKQAIKEEAEYFWQNHEQNDAFPLPDTLNLTGYLDLDLMPDIVRKHPPEQAGFQEYDDNMNRFVLFLSQKNNQDLYLVYNRGQVDSLAAYYGLFPLALVLIVLYLSLWLTYRLSRRTVSPISQLARQVNEIDFSSQDFSLLQEDKLPSSSNDDIQILNDAIMHMGERLESFITRERNFTRDASHELRSPLTVINIATDILLTDPGLSESSRQNVQRIKRSVVDMQELTEAFLLLARETDQALSKDHVCVNDVIDEEIGRSQLLAEEKGLVINLKAEYSLHVDASDKVLSVMLGNLLRNAILYTDEGSVDITVASSSVIISDSGRGISPQQVDEIFKPYYRADTSSTPGHGVGMTIVKRLSDRFNWPIKINSTPGQGTRVEVQFPVSDSHPG